MCEMQMCRGSFVGGWEQETNKRRENSGVGVLFSGTRGLRPRQGSAE